MAAKFEIILEECYSASNKKSEARILTDDLCGQKVGDIEYMKTHSLETTGDYRITRIVNVAAKRRRLKNEQTIKQTREHVRTQEIKRLNELKAALPDNVDGFEIMIDAFLKGLSASQARAEYDRAPDECVQEIAGANVTKDTKQQTKLTERLLGQERQRFSALISAFDFDQDFAIEAWGRGLTVEQAADEYYAPQERTRSASTKVIAESSNEDQGDFITAGRELAAAEGIKLGEALKRVARKNQELHQAYKESCSVQNRVDYGREI